MVKLAEAQDRTRLICLHCDFSYGEVHRVVRIHQLCWLLTTHGFVAFLQVGGCANGDDAPGSHSYVVGYDDDDDQLSNQMFKDLQFCKANHDCDDDCFQCGHGQDGHAGGDDGGSLPKRIDDDIHQCLCDEANDSYDEMLGWPYEEAHQSSQLQVKQIADLHLLK